MLIGAIGALSGVLLMYVCRPPDSASMTPVSITTMQDTSVDLN